MVNAVLLKMAKSYTIVILVKSSKGLELVSILQHRAKNVIEIFIIQHTIIWPSFILIVLRIQKK